MRLEFGRVSRRGWRTREDDGPLGRNSQEWEACI
jgi:hypothetical protein